MRGVILFSEQSAFHDYWTSGYVTMSPYVFTWTGTGAVCDYDTHCGYSAFPGPQSIAGLERCVSMRKPRNYQWQVVGCSAEFRYICESV